jgi:ribose-phosphate pyrophosphokinase
MKVFDRYRNPIDVKFAQYPAGEWRLEAPITQNVVVEASGLELDFWVQAGLVAANAHKNGWRASLVLAYLPAARDDHDENVGGQLYADLVNSLDFDAVHCLDPHSSVVPAKIRRCVTHQPTQAIVASTSDVGGVICPDLGARTRAVDVANALGVPYAIASKKRDFATGRLSGFECPPLPDIDGTWLVVDDICDGGGTFIGLACATGLPKEKLQLWISHAVFSGNARALANHYCRITTTNSFMSLTDVPCTRVPVHSFMSGIYLNHG